MAVLPDAQDLPTQVEGQVARYPSAPAAAPRVLGRYRVRAQLGAGGMGAVFEVDDFELDRTIAAKVILGQSDERQHARFVQEARITGRLAHPGIPPVHEMGRSETGQAYFTMKRIEGKDLAALLAAERHAVRVEDAPRSIAEWLAVFAKICDAVAFAHARGVIHRDLKPANVMVGEFGEVLVCDWGLARALDRADTDMRGGATVGGTGTLDGTVVGTPAYMPPEQANGEIDALDERSDIYALGAILYEILTLRPPYEGPTGDSILAQVLEFAPIRPSERSPGRAIPWELEAIAVRAMAREPSGRYATVSQMVRDITAYLDGRRVGAAHYGVGAAIGHWARRHRAALRVASAMFATALAFSGYLVVQSARARAERERAVAQAAGRLRLAQPDAVRARALRLVAGADTDLARALAPTRQLREERDASLEALRELAGHYAALLQLDRDRDEARRGLHDTLLVTAQLAAVADEVALADHVLSQAEALAAEPEAVRQLRSEVRQGRDARRAWRLQRTAEVIKAVRAGQMATQERLDDAQIQIASFRDRAIVELLVSELDAITARLRGITRSAVVSVAVPTSSEASAGWRELPELARVVDAWLAGQAPSLSLGGAPPTLDASDQASIDTALERLELRDRTARGATLTRSFATLLAEAQHRFLEAEGRREDRVVWLVASALGRLGDGDGPPEALARYCWATWDEQRAVPAGLALVRLRESASEAAGLVHELIGMGPTSHGRWTLAGAWWRQISKLMSDTGEDGRPFADDAHAAPTTARQFLRRGLLRSAQGDRSRALSDFDQALALAPDDPAILANRGIVRLAMNDPSGGLSDFDRAIDLGARSADDYRHRGLARGATGDRTGALADYDHALSIDADHVLSRIQRGMARLEDHDTAGALADLDRAVALDDRNALAFLHRGCVHAATGDYPRAIADYDRTLALDERSVVAFVNRGNARCDTGDFAAALADYDRALALDPRQALAFVNRCRARQELGDLAGALADGDQAIALDSRMAVAYVNRGLARHVMGDLAGARTDYDQAIALDPQSPIAHFNRGNILGQQGELEGALADYDRALELDPTASDVLVNRGALRERLGDASGAAADYGRAIEISSRPGMAHYNRGCIRLAAGDQDGALADFERAVALDPTLVRARVNRGMVRMQRGDLDGALGDLDRAIEIDPRFAEAWRHRARIRRTRGDIPGALADADRAIELDSQGAMTWAYRGDLREASGDLAGALADYDRAIELGLREAPLFSNRGLARQASGKHAEARGDFDRALVIDPAYAPGWHHRGAMRKAAGDLVGALADFDRSIELDPTKATWLTNRGNARRANADLVGALADYDRAIALQPGLWQAHSMRGRALAQLGRPDEARDSFRRARELAPERAHASIDAQIEALGAR